MKKVHLPCEFLANLLPYLRGSATEFFRFASSLTAFLSLSVHANSKVVNFSSYEKCTLVDVNYHTHFLLDTLPS